MRHLHRTHRVSVDWLHEVFQRDDIVLVYEISDRQCADIFTKAFTNADKWKHACELIAVMSPSFVRVINTSVEALKGTFHAPPQVATDEDDEQQPVAVSVQAVTCAVGRVVKCDADTMLHPPQASNAGLVFLLWRRDGKRRT